MLAFVVAAGVWQSLRWPTNTKAPLASSQVSPIGLRHLDTSETRDPLHKHHLALVRRWHAQGHKTINCVYGPMDWMKSTGFVAYDFWLERAPDDLASAKAYQSLSGSITHPFESLGRGVVSACPPTQAEAAALRQSSRL